MWENENWFLYHDNAPVHTALSIQQFLAKKQVTTLRHPPYSPDLAPCDFFLFQKFKSTLKETHFDDLENIKTNVTRPLKSVQKEEFSSCMVAWRKRMERCIETQRNYFEGNGQ